MVSLDIRTLGVSALLTVATVSAGDSGAAPRLLDQGDRRPLTLWYDAPANLRSGWTQALPVGNGRLGAMVFGGTLDERIQLNEDTIWAGPPVPVQPADAAQFVAEARRLFFAGKPDEGEALIRSRVLAPRIAPRSYQTLGDLRLRLDIPGQSSPESIVIAGWRRGPVQKDHEPAQLAANFDDGAWTVVSDAAGLSVPEHSTVVFRAAFDVTAEQIQGGLNGLDLSPIDDAGIVVLNGVEIGRTRSWSESHSFSLARALKPGRNLLAIAVKNIGGAGHLSAESRLVASQPTEQYRRELDLDTAVATATFAIKGVTYTREVFSSAVDDVLVVRLTTSQPGALAFDLELSRPVDAETQSDGSAALTLRGQAGHDGKHLGVKFNARVRVLTEGGSISGEGKQLRVRGANSATVLIAAATDYNRQDPGAPLTRDRDAACNAVLDKAVQKGYAQLRQDSVADHQRFFRRVTLDLGVPPSNEVPTDQRLARVQAGQTDVGLEALFFQYGRYLLICSSRPGDQPANLQGIWNEHLDAPWNSDYHTNIRGYPRTGHL